MKLAYRVLFLTLTILTLLFTVSAQTTLRPETDDRNIAPTVGTGGPVGGPTGLFTVYDGQTLRRGEYTFGIAYSNYDRDPGDVDITEVPVNFQIGLSDHLELFFNTDAYRAVKTNSNRNLSSLYLPNASLRGAPAIVLAPNGLAGGQFAGQAVYRPAGNQAFVPYPFAGGSAGHFGYVPGPLVGQSGNPTLGTGTSGNGGTASNFPGIGSIYGSILPGVVLSTTPLTGSTTGQIVPGTFATAPSYLPDAPLLGRNYGTSSFSTYSVGAKIRFTGPRNPIGVGLIPFYRFYQDDANSSGGFNQLQRGASPGAGRGDFGLVAFGDARVRKWMNFSANLGYIYNSSIKADFPGGEVTLLDRGDELLAAFGVDFPVNKYFQPIIEFRSTQYVGGRTPNAFENNPLEGIVGAKIFATRWAGLGFAYRHHFNAQDRESFDDERAFNNNVTIACTSDAGPDCSPTTIAQGFNGVPTGFRPSTDPHGFILNAWIGRRNKRQKEVVNKPPTINSLELSEKTVKLPCKDGERPVEGETCDDDQTITVRTDATDPEGDVLTYNYTVSGGRIVGQGSNVTWDLSGTNPGTYTITSTIDDGCGVCAEPKTETVEVAECECVPPTCVCGDLTLIGPPSSVSPGETMTFTAQMSEGDDITYNWSVDKGSIISGQGTSTIRVSTDGLSDETVTAKVDVTSSCEGCTPSGSETGIVTGNPLPIKIDDFGNIKANDVRARIDAFIADLQNNPGSQGYVINYGTSRQIAARERLIRNHFSFRGYDLGNIVFVSGGAGEFRTKLWRVPAGADASTIDE